MERKTNRIKSLVLSLIVGLTAQGIAATQVDAEGIRLRSNSGGAQQIQLGGIGGLTAGFVLNCAPGFSMAGKKMGHPSTWTDWYVCSTPVLTCPTQVQDNGLKSAINVKAIIQTVGGDPDGGTTSFRVQYVCDYGYTAQPVP